jgi:hypothetical protein
MMKGLKIPLVFLLALSCLKKEGKVSDACMDIIKSDSFYFALPLDEGQYKARYRLENYLAQVIDSGVQRIDFDCAVVINPTNGQLDQLKEILQHDFDENIRINTRHSEAVGCIIESHGIPTLNATGQFLRFIGADRTWDLDIRKDTLAEWKFILFKKTKEPTVFPSVALTIKEVDQYFGNKE